MKLRNIDKMNYYNTGNRTLYESVLNRYVLKALQTIKKHNDTSKMIIIGGVALSYHTKPYMTDDIDIITTSYINIKYLPNNIYRNKIKIDTKIVSESEFELYKQNSIVSNGWLIANTSDLINRYLIDFNYDNRYKCEKIIHNCIVDLNNINDIDNFKKYIIKKDRDYNMNYVKKIDNYFKTKVFEGSSGYIEVDNAFKDWISQTRNEYYNKQMLIGGMALIHYDIMNRTTTDADFIFLNKDEIPVNVPKFKKNRISSFKHIITHVEIEVLTSSIINASQEFIEATFKEAYQKDGYLIASPSGIIALKLKRFNDNDIRDIINLKKQFIIDLTPYVNHLSEEEINNFNSLNNE